MSAPHIPKMSRPTIILVLLIEGPPNVTPSLWSLVVGREAPGVGGPAHGGGPLALAVATGGRDAEVGVLR